MKVTRVSQYSQIERTIDFGDRITRQQMKELSLPDRRKIQDIFPNLSEDEREFLMTGVTAEEWDQLFPEE